MNQPRNISKTKNSLVENTPKFKKNTPNLVVQDVKTTMEFYRDVLGFEVTMKFPREDTLAWVAMRRDNVEIQFQSYENTAKGGTRAVIEDPLTFFYIRAENVQALYERIKDRVIIIRGLQKNFYGIQGFTMRDLNGYLLIFTEALPSTEKNTCFERDGEIDKKTK
ncbi:MAG: VOC family protein [Candidatus Hodarchaeota archaeon]